MFKCSQGAPAIEPYPSLSNEVSPDVKESGFRIPLYVIQNSQILMESMIHFGGTSERFGIRNPRLRIRDPGSGIRDPGSKGWDLESESHLDFFTQGERFKLIATQAKTVAPDFH